MINVETDDYARRRGPALRLPDRRARASPATSTAIRSYEKLTSEGMTLRGHEVVTLLEQTLPARFGGAATDYQLVEEVDEALPTLSLVVSPRVGARRRARGRRGRALRRSRGGGRDGQDVSNIWRRAGTLRVVRREPYATRGQDPARPRHGRDRLAGLGCLLAQADAAARTAPATRPASAM